MKFDAPRILAVTLTLTLALAASAQPAEKPRPAEPGGLMTRWAKEVAPDNVHPEYPRPQMTREKWLNLNGTWQFQVAAEKDEPPFGKKLSGTILVPFPVESALSGVKQRADRLWYRRTFNVDNFRLPDGRVLLHFGAVDWEAAVWINGTLIGEHRGGYDPFTYDITAALKPKGEQEIVIHVFDPSDAATQPHGKQVNKPHGIWYTPTTGIWQTVWIEPVPATYIDTLKLTPDVDKQRLHVEVVTAGKIADHRVEVAMFADNGDEVSVSAQPDEPAVLPVQNMKLWSPDSPHLYDLRVRLLRDGTPIDEVRSYFGMRKIAVGKDAAGVTRLLLNGQPLFQMGVLDQGFWPDGIYTAPTDEALRYDVEVLKQLGFNMIRKHVKVEPARWYYWCDKLGVVVWQDMPSGDKSIGPDDPDVERSPESVAQYEFELRNLIETHYNSPSIIMWVIFNEGWGQFDTARLADWAHKLDPTRLVDNASGWTDRGVGDVFDIHVYPGPGCPPPEAARAAVLGEFGGLGLPLAGHTWQSEKNWGYRNLTTRDELTERYVALIEKLRFLIHDPGCSAAVYTQTTDVETECNGLMTYDREIIKPDSDRVRDAHAKLHLPPPTVTEIVPTSRKTGVEWRYTFETPSVAAGSHVGRSQSEREAQASDPDKPANRANASTDKPENRPAQRPVVAQDSGKPAQRLAADEETGTGHRSAAGSDDAAEAPFWAMPAFDDSGWKTGPGGFGTKGTPGAVARTEWKTADIWLRRRFDLPASIKPTAAEDASPAVKPAAAAKPVDAAPRDGAKPDGAPAGKSDGIPAGQTAAQSGNAPVIDLRLLVHHDEDVEIYINGVLAAKADGFTTAYDFLPLAPAARAALKPRDNILAVHCRQTGGGQYIDVGMVEIK
jgi:hypothetical protein